MNETIIPPVCLNCEHLKDYSGSDASLPIPGRCEWGPVHASIDDARVHRCDQRTPLERPVYTVPVQQEDVDAAADMHALETDTGEESAE